MLNAEHTNRVKHIYDHFTAVRLFGMPVRHLLLWRTPTSYSRDNFVCVCGWLKYMISEALYRHHMKAWRR
jgi:hypothetical protein